MIWKSMLYGPREVKGHETGMSLFNHLPRVCSASESISGFPFCFNNAHLNTHGACNE